MIRVEFEKQVSRLRTYVILGSMVAVAALMTLVFRVGSPSGGEGLVALGAHSGLNMALVVLAHTVLILPVVVALLAGSAISEEAGWGTLSYLLLRPVSRRSLLASKLAVVVTLVLAATLVLSLAAVVAGIVAFGWHPLDTTDGTTISAGAALGRIALATPYIAWGMAGIMSVTFFLSVVTDAPLNAFAGGFGLVVVSQILDSFSAMGAVRNVLPTHYWRAWEGLFASPVSMDGMVRGFALQLPYVIVFLALAWWCFRRKDILT